MKFLLTVSLAANLVLGIALNGMISDWQKYSAGVEQDFKTLATMEHMNYTAIHRMREIVENAKAKSFVACMRRYKSAERCGKKAAK